MPRKLGDCGKALMAVLAVSFGDCVGASNHVDVFFGGFVRSRAGVFMKTTSQISHAYVRAAMVLALAVSAYCFFFSGSTFAARALSDSFRFLSISTSLASSCSIVRPEASFETRSLMEQ